MKKDQALHKVAQLCGRQEQAESDIRTKLKRWEISPQDEEEIIETLYKHRFLDPMRYALAYTRDKATLNYWGCEKIKMMLKRKGIPSEVIVKALETLNRDSLLENCISLLSTKHRILKESDPYKHKAKLIRFALGRGFELELIYRALNRLNMNIEEE